MREANLEYADLRQAVLLESDLSGANLRYADLRGACFLCTSLANPAYHYARYGDPLLKEYAKKAFAVTEMAGYGKFDIRLDQSGRYFFIDANCNPYFGPKELGASIALILDLYGIPFERTLEKLIRHTSRCR